MTRAARILSVALITAGIVVMLDVGLTLGWREPVSSLYGSFEQRAAANQLDELESSYPSRSDLRAVGRVRGLRGKVRVLARRFEPRLRNGEGFGRIVVPSMGVNTVMVHGTDTVSLQKGPAHYPETPLPGQGGTTAVAGHRTTYLAPFRDIESVRRGDEVTLRMPYATLTYRVEKTRVVDPGDVGVVRPVGYERIVLTACHPLYSAAQRYVVFARLSSVALFAGAGGRPWLAN